MSERLLSVGLDVGTTSTQMILSGLDVENRAGSFAVPEMEIVRREILYRSPVHFTPLISGDLVDAPALRHLVEQEYAAAGIAREQVDTGAIIITGETSRKENAGAVLRELSSFAGEFVVATAGPHLESVLAAKGAGAVEHSQNTGKPVLHMDIGGGTSNLAWIMDGRIVKTGCLNVGGRLVKLTSEGCVSYVSPALAGITRLKPGDRPGEEELTELARVLTHGLEMAAGLREKTELFHKLTTRESLLGEGTRFLEALPEKGWIISFSGGVADCIETRHPTLAFGDIGPVLGRAIRESRLCSGEYILGRETIRATVIGAGCHSAQLSGSTVFHRNAGLPRKNLRTLRIPEALEQDPSLSFWLRQQLDMAEEPVILALKGPEQVSYRQVTALAEEILRGVEDGDILVCLEQDMAKALGHALAVRAEENRGILCVDRIRLPEESYLDVGVALGPAMPVVVKTLVLGANQTDV